MSATIESFPASQFGAAGAKLRKTAHDDLRNKLPAPRYIAAALPTFRSEASEINFHQGAVSSRQERGNILLLVLASRLR